MGSRAEYTTCMVPWMKGGGPDRKERFCLGAKLCSGKANNQEEAVKLCAEAAANPKPPKARKARGKCTIDSAALASCVIKLIDNTTNVSQLGSIIAGCTGQRVEKSLTRESFIKKCFKENIVTGDIKETQKLRSLCTAKWKELEAG